MQITVFGASGKVGREVVALALERGYTVKIFVHRSNPFGSNPKIAVVKGSVSDREAVAQAVQGSQAVISTLGSWGTKNKNIVSVGIKSIIPAMQAQNIQRIITVTGSGALWTKDKPGLFGRLGHALIRLAAPKILNDGEKHLELLGASPLKWTSIRSPAMTNSRKTSYSLSFKVPAPWATIPRKAVAECMVDLAENNDYQCKAPFISK